MMRQKYVVSNIYVEDTQLQLLCGLYIIEIAIVPEPVFFSPSPKSDYTVSAIKIVQFCM